MGRWGVWSLLAVLAATGCGEGEHRASATADAAPIGDGAAKASTLSTSAADPLPPPADPVPSDPRVGRDPSLETVLTPLQDVTVVARLDGEVLAFLAEEGQRVGAGATLARIDDRERRAVLEEREAEVARAESAWQRAQQLKSQNVISDEEHLQAQADWQIAKARRDQAMIEHEWCTVRAPISGTVSRRRVQVGQMVNQGDVLYRICNPDRLRAELLLPESYLGRVRVGQAATLTPSAGGAPQAASVTLVNPIVDPASGTFHVWIDVDNRRARLPAGISVHVELAGLDATRPR